MDEGTIISWIETDTWMMEILRTAAQLKLPDWCVSAGFVRSKVWDVLHKFGTRTPLPDVDVVYYDASNLDESTEKMLDAKLRSWLPDVRWSVKNQARMHIAKGEQQYSSTEDALAKYPETCTAVGVRLEQDGALTLIAPLGVADLLDVVVRPTPHFVMNAAQRASVYNARLAQKNWREKWPRVRAVELDGAHTPPKNPSKFNLNIRRADPTEAELLSELALQSKAVWDYDDAFIAQCRGELTLTVEFIEENEVYVCETDGSVAGFYALLLGSTEQVVLDFLYIHPDFLHKGCGSALWQHAVSCTEEHGARQIHIDADPHAESFYAAMGAKRVGEVPSGSIPGRFIPHMVYSIK